MGRDAAASLLAIMGWHLGFRVSCPINSVIFDSDNLHFLVTNNSCTMDIQLNQTSIGILYFINIFERLGGKDPVTLSGRFTRFSGIVTEEPIAKPATNCCAGYSF